MKKLSQQKARIMMEIPILIQINGKIKLSFNDFPLF